MSIHPSYRTLAALLVGILIPSAALAQKSYDPGATDAEIKIGSVMAYTGAQREYASVSRAENAYFQMINDRGGVNGRKINFIRVDNGSDATKSLALAKQLVEQDHVLLIFSPLGTDSNLAMRAYLNEQKVPQLFVESNSAIFDDPVHFPFTMGFFATYQMEGAAYARYILKNKKAAKIGVLYANDDAGKEYLAGVRAGLSEQADAMIVKAIVYESPNHSIEAQIRELQASGADAFLNLTFGLLATQAIRAAYDQGWHPLQFIPNSSISVSIFIDPAGTEKAQGIIANARSKSWRGREAASDPAVKDYLDWLRQYNPQANPHDQNNVAGYERAEALVEVLKNCGDTLTRANVMQQAANLDVELGMLRPGIRLHTSPTDYQPIKQLYLIKFNGQAWMPVGPVTGE